MPNFIHIDKTNEPLYVLKVDSVSYSQSAADARDLLLWLYEHAPTNTWKHLLTLSGGAVAAMDDGPLALEQFMQGVEGAKLTLEKGLSKARR